MFDDVVLHYVKNSNNKRRISLFMDVRRRFNNTIIDFLNGLVLWAVKYNPTVLSIVENANALSNEKGR